MTPNIVKSEIPGVLVIGPKVFCDDRGLFYESYNKRTFGAVRDLSIHFVQDNHSRSAHNGLQH